MAKRNRTTARMRLDLTACLEGDVRPTEVYVLKRLLKCHEVPKDSVIIGLIDPS